MAAPEFFFFLRGHWGIKGGKHVLGGWGNTFLRGQKSKKLPNVANFLPFFLLKGHVGGVLGLRARYIHRKYNVGCLWGNVKKCSGDLPFLLKQILYVNEVF